MAWSESIKNKTRECAGDGAMLKNENWKNFRNIYLKRNNYY